MNTMLRRLRTADLRQESHSLIARINDAADEVEKAIEYHTSTSRKLMDVAADEIDKALKQQEPAVTERQRGDD